MVANNNNNLSTPSLNTKFQPNSHTATPNCNSASSQQVEQLSKQLEHYRSIIEQQESLLQVCLLNNRNLLLWMHFIENVNFQLFLYSYTLI